MYDIIVIGGGPAGMTAALYGLRAGKSVLVIEKNGFGGQITYSPKVENFPGNISMSGNEFADRFLDQIMAQGAEVELDTVTAVRDEGAVKRVIGEESEWEARAVVIAVGVKHRMLGLPGEYDLVGNGISFCAVCDGDFYKGQTVCVAGGGNSALQEAILLSETCERVIMVQDMDFFTGEKKLQDILFSRPNVESHTGCKITGFLRDGEGLSGISCEKTATGESFDIACAGLFVAIGLIPENDSFSDIVPLNDYGYVAAAEDCETGHPGIYCAGDCRAKSVRQLTTAVSDGAVAALAACRYIDAM
jgi:thioredoxin reductase (NADPH)